MRNKICANTNAMELNAFFGIFLLAEAEKRRDETIWNIFLDKMSNSMFNATTRVNRFEPVMRHLRFDDKRTRAIRFKDDLYFL
jgi:hypothetical protein